MPLVRALLSLLLGYALFRFLRGLAAPAPPRERPRPRPRGRGLDPERAVEARWSEVAEEDEPGR